MHIDFHDETKSVLPEHIDLINRLMTFTAKKERVANGAELSISFVNNRDIQELNRNYRQIDRPTDVISFALEEQVEGELEIIDEKVPVILGDIVISVDKAKEQAEEYNHSFERELAFLALHGFLHLLGYDHMNEADEKVMFAKQDEILGAFKLER